MVRKIQVEHVDEYLHCPLFYRYRRELNLPFNGTEDHLLLKSAKRAVASWFHALGKGVNRKMARAKVGRTLKSLWAKDGGDDQGFPLAHAKIMSILLTIDKVFNQKTDIPIDGGLLIGAALEGSMFEDVIDGLYMHNDQKPGARQQDKFLVAVQVVEKNNITSPRVIQMRKALIRYSLNSALRPNPYSIKLLQISVPDLSRTWYNLDKHAYDQFLFLGRSIIRHLDAKLYVPTANPAWCRGCAYNQVCSNQFCEPELTHHLVGRARTKLLSQSEPA